jgi:uncharacterized protein YndB with AHSA1/START domain
MSEVHRQVVLPAPPARVWEALSVPGQLSAWFGARADIDPRPGGRALFRWPDGAERGAVVETAEAPRLLVFRWLPFDRRGGGPIRLIGAGRVRIELEPHEGGTLLTVVEIGVPGAEGPLDHGGPSGTPGSMLLRPADAIRTGAP